jgi:hypothetical protein
MRLLLTFLILLMPLSAQPLSAEPLAVQPFSSFKQILPQHGGFVTAALPPETVVIEKQMPKGGETYKLFGKTGEMVLFRGKNTLSVALTVKNEACEADFTPLAPVSMTPVAKSGTLTRYHSKLKECDVFIDLLPDAALLQGGMCKISDTCSVDLGGLWGVPEQDLPLDKTFEKQWSVTEKAMNKSRKGITKALGNTQNMRDFLSEHLDFTANRQKICLDYGKGQSWCSLKLTQMRSFELESRLTTLRD